LQWSQLSQLQPGDARFRVHEHKKDTGNLLQPQAYGAPEAGPNERSKAVSLRAALLCRCFDDLCYTCVRSRVDDDTHIHWTLCIHINTCVVAGAHSLSAVPVHHGVRLHGHDELVPSFYS